MPDSVFSLSLVQFLFENRWAPATAFFQAWTALGEIEGYVLVVCLIHVAFDKRLAVRLSVVALVAMSLNYLLKTLIANPRPFVAEGTYADKWAVSEWRAQELVAEYSTPSGHAMVGAAFYAYLYAAVKRPAVRAAAIAALVLTGLSRPYLGVHYFEDVVLGWALGLSLALVVVRYGDVLGEAWRRLAWSLQAALLFSSSALLWLVTRSAYDATGHGEPHAFLSYTGLLAGIVLTCPLEARWVDFDPKSARFPVKMLRYAVSVGLVLGTLLVLDAVFAFVAPDASWLGNVLRYLRYALAGASGMLGAPYVFVRLGLASTCEHAPGSRRKRV